MHHEHLRTYAALSRFAVVEPADHNAQRCADEFNTLLEYLSRQIGQDLSEYKIGQSDLYELPQGGYRIMPGRLSLRAHQTLAFLSMLTPDGRVRSFKFASETY